MKILVIGLAKIKYMPYLNFYLDNIDLKNSEVHVAFWNRDSKPEMLDQYSGVLFHEYRFSQTNGVPFLKKIKPYLGFRSFILDILKNNKFDLLILLHTPAGVLLYNQLKRVNFIFDYRDSTYEKNPFFKRIVGNIIKRSLFTFTSSDAFRTYFPKKCQDKVFTSHNLLLDSLNHREDRKTFLRPSKRIRISFWGFIRHRELNVEFIKKVSKDTRFELHYYGREQETAMALKAFCNKNKIQNVFFHGEYKPEERYEFLKNTDIIHNIYKDRNMMLAMGNKYYDGIIFRIPQLCQTGSYMGKRVTKMGLGLECSPYDENFLDKVYLYFNEMDEDVFEKNTDKELERVLSEYYQGAKKIKDLDLKL